MELWEILVPTEMIRDGKLKPIRTRYHKIWDKKVQQIAGGLTISPPHKGQWCSPRGELFTERMIPVRIVCDEEQIKLIINMTMNYYNQEAVLAYLISSQVLLVHRDSPQGGDA
jgi:hypothetical protein